MQSICTFRGKPVAAISGLMTSCIAESHAGRGREGEGATFEIRELFTWKSASYLFISTSSR
jgi:hypothetical protein